MTVDDRQKDEQTAASCSTGAQSKPRLRKRNGSDKKWLKKWRAAGMSEEAISELLRKRREISPREPDRNLRQHNTLHKGEGNKGGIVEKARIPKKEEAPEKLVKARATARAEPELGTRKEGASRKPETTGTGKEVPLTKKVVEGGKRNRSEEATPPISKKRRTGKQPTFREVVCESLKVAIIDKNHPEGKIMEPKNQQALRVKFEEWQVEALSKESSFVPRFHWSGFFNGHFRVTCVDMATQDFLRSKIAENSALWDGANLEVVGKNDVPKLKRISIWLPNEFREAREILSFMDRLNRDMELGTSEWKILNREVREGVGQWLQLGVGEKTLKTLERTEGKIFYLNRKVRFTLPKGDAEGVSEGKSASAEAKRVEPQPSVSRLTKEGDIDPLSDAIHEMELDTESDLGSMGSLYSFGELGEAVEVPPRGLSDISQEMEDLNQTVRPMERINRTPSQEEILDIIGVQEMKTSTPEKDKSSS